MKYRWSFNDDTFWAAVDNGDIPRGSDEYMFFLRSTTGSSEDYEEMREAVSGIVSNCYSPTTAIGIKNLLQSLRTGENDMIWLRKKDPHRSLTVTVIEKEEDHEPV